MILASRLQTAPLNTEWDRNELSLPRLKIREHNKCYYCFETSKCPLGSLLAQNVLLWCLPLSHHSQKQLVRAGLDQRDG